MVLLPNAQPVAWIILLPLAYLLHFYSGVEGKLQVAHADDALAVPRSARTYANVIVAAGAIVLAGAGLNWQSSDLARFFAYLAIACLTATWKVRLPGMTGTVSVSFVMLLVAVLQTGFAETMLIAAVVGVVQSVWKPQRKPILLQILFSAACLELSGALAYFICRVALGPVYGTLLLVGFATVVLYFSNTVLVAGVLTLLGGENLQTLWQRCYFWSFPYYLVGSAAAAMILTTSHAMGWMPSLAILPIMGMVYLSYHAQLWLRRAVQSVPA